MRGHRPKSTATALLLVLVVPLASAPAAAETLSPWVRPADVPAATQDLVHAVIAGEEIGASLRTSTATARAALERERETLREGLAIKPCALPASANFMAALDRAHGVLGLALLDATRPGGQRDPTRDLVDVLSMGSGLARCGGGLLALGVGAVIRKNAREIARVLGERGQLKDASLRRLAQHMSNTELTLDDLTASLEQERKIARAMLAPLRSAGTIAYDAAATEALIDGHYRKLARLAREDQAGWADRLDEEAARVLSAEDRQIIDDMKALRHGGDLEKLGALVAAVGRPVPRNLVGRIAFELQHLSARHAQNVKQEIDAERLHVRAFAAGSDLVIRTRAGQPPPPSSDGVDVSKTGVRATIHGRTHAWTLRLEEPLVLELAAETSTSESGARAD